MLKNVKKVLFSYFSLALISFILLYSLSGFFSGLAFAQSSITITAFIPSVCGNEVVDSGEECDGSNLNNKTCVSLDYASGDLTCQDCFFDTSDCVAFPEAPPPSRPTTGGAASFPAPSVIFRGKAYPLSDVFLIKNSQLVSVAKADINANFEINLLIPAAGIYSFGLWAEDSQGFRSSVETLTVNVPSGAITIVSGILLPATMVLDKSEVRSGDVLRIFGQSAPEAKILISIGFYQRKTKADASGVWNYILDTGGFGYGDYLVSVRSVFQEAVSNFSQSLFFKIGEKNVFTEAIIKYPIKGDFNNDFRVNLIDFSILAYYHQRPSPPLHLDLNADGKIDLVDFSIMAFYWTG